MVRKAWFWYVLVCAVADQAFGQNAFQQPQETRVPGGRFVFVPDPPAGPPVADPAFQAPQPQAVTPAPVYQPPLQVYQHPQGCQCAQPACRARLLCQHQRTFIERKLLEKRTTVTVTETERPLPTRVIDSCSPSQRPCLQQRQGWQPYPWRPYQQYGYAYRPQAFSIAGLFGFNSGVYLRTGGNGGYGGYAGYGGGYPPPYAQSGQNYGGAQSWYGGRQW